MSRPRKEIDWQKLAKICQYPLRNEDIAAILDLSVDTIERACRKQHKLTFAEYKEQKQSNMRFTLIAKQIEVAKNGNVAMLIWLGKQYLGQTDKQVEGLDGKTIKTITLNYSEDALKKAAKDDEQR